MLKACLNGNRQSGSHPLLPLTPDELALDAVQVVRAGAEALHIHPRREDGRETLEADFVGLALNAVRNTCPDIPVGVSTGAWIEPDANRRLTLVRKWKTLPDFAGVNFSEPGAAELCQALLAMGIGIEAGLWTASDVHLFAKSGNAQRCLRVLIEPIRTQDILEALATAEEIVRLLDHYQIDAPRLLHGKEGTVWPLIDDATRRKYDTRIGMEDTLLLPDGRTAQDNAELVRIAHERIVMIKSSRAYL